MEQCVYNSTKGHVYILIPWNATCMFIVQKKYEVFPNMYLSLFVFIFILFSASISWIY